MSSCSVTDVQFSITHGPLAGIWLLDTRAQSLYWRQRVIRYDGTSLTPMMVRISQGIVCSLLCVNMLYMCLYSYEMLYRNVPLIGGGYCFN